MEFDQKLGQLIATWRSGAGLSQEALGEVIGLDQASVSRMESGNRQVSVELLLKILNALGSDLAGKSREISEMFPQSQSSSLWTGP